MRELDAEIFGSLNVQGNWPHESNDVTAQVLRFTVTEEKIIEKK
jgi:hypothetical protein